MGETLEKICPACGQRLRFPRAVGGRVMVCPECGQTFRTDFKLSSGGQQTAETIVALPSNLLKKLLRRIKGTVSKG